MTHRSLLLLPLALAGCSSTPTRFWTVEPIAATAPPASTRSIAPVQITAVHVPLAIDRLEIVQHDEADRVKVLDFDRWSAPPGDLLRRALTQDLLGLLPPGSVIFPEAPTPTGARRIVVDVLDVRQVGDAYVMQVSWSTALPAAPTHPLSLRAAAGTGDVQAQTQALARMTADLAARIAQTLTAGDR